MMVAGLSSLNPPHLLKSSPPCPRRLQIQTLTAWNTSVSLARGGTALWHLDAPDPPVLVPSLPPSSLQDLWPRTMEDARDPHTKDPRGLNRLWRIRVLPHLLDQNDRIINVFKTRLSLLWV